MVEEVDLGIQDPPLKDIREARRRREEEIERLRRQRQQQIQEQRRQQVVSRLRASESAFADEVALAIEQGADFRVTDDGEVVGEAREIAASKTEEAVEIQRETRQPQQPAEPEQTIQEEAFEELSRGELRELAGVSDVPASFPRSELISRARERAGVEDVPASFAPSTLEERIDQREAEVGRDAQDVSQQVSIQRQRGREVGGVSTREGPEAVTPEGREVPPATQPGAERDVETAIEETRRLESRVQQRRQQLQSLRQRVEEGERLTGEQGDRLTREESLRRIEEAEQRLDEQEQALQERRASLEAQEFTGERAEEIQEEQESRAFQRLSGFERGVVGAQTVFGEQGFEQVGNLLSGDVEGIQETAQEQFGEIRRGETSITAESIESLAAPSGRAGIAIGGGGLAAAALRGAVGAGSILGSQVIRSGLMTTGGITGALAAQDISKGFEQDVGTGIARTLEVATDFGGFGLGFSAGLGRTVSAPERISSRIGRRGIEGRRNRLVELPESELPGLQETGFRPGLRGRGRAIRPIEEVGIRGRGIRGVRPGRQGEAIIPEEAARTTAGRPQEPTRGFTETELEVLQQRGRTPVQETPPGEDILFTGPEGQRVQFGFTEEGALTVERAEGVVVQRTGLGATVERSLGDLFDLGGTRRGEFNLRAITRPTEVQTRFQEPTRQLSDFELLQAGQQQVTRVPDISGRTRAVQAATGETTATGETGDFILAGAFLAGEETGPAARPGETLLEQPLLLEEQNIGELFDTQQDIRLRTGLETVTRQRERTRTGLGLSEAARLDVSLASDVAQRQRQAQETGFTGVSLPQPRQRTGTGTGVQPPRTGRERRTTGSPRSARPGLALPTFGLEEEQPQLLPTQQTETEGIRPDIVPEADIISVTASELTTGRATTPVGQRFEEEFAQPVGLLTGFRTIEERPGLEPPAGEEGAEPVIDLPGTDLDIDVDIDNF